MNQSTCITSNNCICIAFVPIFTCRCYFDFFAHKKSKKNELKIKAKKVKAPLRFRNTLSDIISELQCNQMEKKYLMTEPMDLFYLFISISFIIISGNPCIWYMYIHYIRVSNMCCWFDK